MCLLVQRRCLTPHHNTHPMRHGDRETRKRIHWGCHSAAIICLALGLIAVLQSHRLKLPVPMPDWCVEV